VPWRADTLVAFSHGGILSRIAHHQFRRVRFPQVVQPGGRGPLFKGDQFLLRGRIYEPKYEIQSRDCGDMGPKLSLAHNGS
jgi:hypothetical protein